MGPAIIALIVIGVLVLLLVMWAVSIYNNLVTLRNRFKNAFAQIDVQLKRRFDLIPNLVETAKGYLAHERGTLEAVIQAGVVVFAIFVVAVNLLVDLVYALVDPRIRVRG